MDAAPVRPHPVGPTDPAPPMTLWKKLWIQLRGERAWIAKHGTVREKEAWGLIERPNYAYGLLRAADVARYFGVDAVTVCEFGVASGHGLLNLVELAELFRAETGIEFRVVGFDTGEGLPTIQGHKDHPELWNRGDFVMEHPDGLRGALEGRCELILGDIGDTVDAFRESLDPACPLGFVSVDVDIYSGTVSTLRCLTGAPEQYLPAVGFYFDDVGFYFANEWCGELAAIREFNDANELRKIDLDRSVYRRQRRSGLEVTRHMYIAHMLDHPARMEPRSRDEMTLHAHGDFMRSNFLF